MSYMKKREEGLMKEKRNYKDRWKVRKTVGVINFETQVTINGIAIKITSYLFVVSE